MNQAQSEIRALRREVKRLNHLVFPADIAEERESLEDTEYLFNDAHLPDDGGEWRQAYM